MPSKKDLSTFMKDSKNTSFLGIPISQWHADLWLWEKFFARNKIRSFIELGTGSGGMSLFFLMQSYQYRFKFNTFDIEIPQALDTQIGKMMNLKSHFKQGDIMVQLYDVIENLLEKSDHPIMLYCDNGNKPLEVKTFSMFLESGDYIAVHDWGKEFNVKDIPERLSILNFSEVAVINSYTRWLRRKS